MKRHLALLSSLFFISAVVLSACGSPNANTSSAAGDSAVSPTAAVAKPTAAVAKPAAAVAKPAAAVAKPAAAVAKPTAAVAKPTAAVKLPARAGQAGGRFANLTTKQRACLVKQGLTIPTPRASLSPRPTGSPNVVRSPAANGAKGNSNATKMAAAYKACGMAAPIGGSAGGARGTFKQVKFQAFQKCMTVAGFTSTGGVGRYDQADPDTAVALVKCQKKTGFKMPKRGQPGSSN